MFFVLYGHTDDAVFNDFPKISEHLPKILQKLSEGHTNVAENFPRITKNCRRLRKTFKENPGMFRLYTNEFEYDLRVKLDISEIIDMFTSEDMGGKHATRVPGGLV